MTAMITEKPSSKSQSPVVLHRIWPGGYQVFHRGTRKLIGTVERRADGWQAIAFSYDSGVPKNTRHYGAFATRREAADEVWIQRDHRTDQP